MSRANKHWTTVLPRLRLRLFHQEKPASLVAHMPAPSHCVRGPADWRVDRVRTNWPLFPAVVDCPQTDAQRKRRISDILNRAMDIS